MTTLLLAALVAAGQAPASITYLEPAAPLSRLLPALSKLLKQPLDAAPTMKTNVVCIDVHDVSPAELLKKLAWATVGEWQTQKDGTQVLVPAAKDRRIQAAEELSRRAGLITKYLNSNQPRNESQQFDGTQILRAIDPMTLAAIDEDERLVFSTRPNRLQVPFSTDVSQLIFDSIANSKERNFVDPNGIGILQTRPDARKVDKADFPVVVMYIREDLVLSGTLQLYDQDGRDISGIPFHIFSLTTTPHTAVDNSKRISYSPDTLRFAKFVAGETAGLNVTGLFHFRMPPNKIAGLSEIERSEIEAKLVATEKFDPLAYASDLLRSLSRTTGDQVVACLPDSFICTFPLVFSGTSTVKALTNELSANQDIDVRSADGWLAARPRDPARAEAARLDRLELAQLMRMLQSRDYLRFGDLELLAQAGYGKHLSSLIDFWSVLVRPAFYAETLRFDWEMLRLFASLSPDQQTLLKSGQTIKLALLEGEQSRLVRSIVYGPQYMNHWSNGIQIEPTEVAPNQPFTLSLKSFESPVVLAEGISPDRGGRVLGSEPKTETEIVSSGGGIAARGGPEPFPFGGGDAFYRALPERLRKGSRVTYTLQLLGAPGIIRTGQFSDDFVSPSLLTTFGELRNKYQAAYNSAVNNVLRQKLDQSSATGTRPTDP